MGEVFVVEFREAVSVVDGLAHNNHGCKGEMVVVDNLSQVFQYTAIDTLVGPGEMIASCHGSIFWVFLQ